MGEPTPCTASSNRTVTVSVARNLNSPIFTNNGTYSRKIQESSNLNSVVTTVRATDQDSRSPYRDIEYRIIGEGAAVGLFNVGKTDGNIRIRNSLTSDPSLTYRVN